MPGSYPLYHSLVDKLAAKIITRVVQDGVDMESAIKEAINYAELSRQQTIHLCSVLADYGLVYNGDPKNYFYTSGDMGKGFPSTENGYVVYASSGEDKYHKIFAAVEEMQEAGFTNDQILDINPELDKIIAMMDDYKQKYLDIMNMGAEELQMAADSKGKTVKGQAADVQKPTPENIEQALGDAKTEEPPVDQEKMVDEELPESTPTGDETMFEDETALENAGEVAGGATVTVSPSPEDLKGKISNAPKWKVENILSIDKAKNYYDNLKKELEEIVFNDNITIGEDLMKQYDEARSAIDEQINKIDEAQKQTKKLEDKEDDLALEFEEEGEPGLPGAETPKGNERPTEDLLAEEEGIEPAPAK